MIDISPIIDSAREFNLKNQKIQTHLQHHPMAFAREFQTVIINLGRQSGHSTYISNNLQENDLCVFLKTSKVCWFKDHFGSFNNLVDFRTIKNFAYKKYHTIWVDDASLFTERELDEIYGCFCGTVEQFVLLG